nr:unnamed protein product [Callosobruchus analis]
MCKYLHLAPGFRFFISLSRFLAGSSEISSSSGSGTDSDSDTPLSKLLPSTSSAPSDLADNDNDGAQNILSLLSDQSTSIKGPEIHSDVASLLTGFLQNGVAKESRNATMDSYPCIANCAALQPPEINPEIRACLDASALKQDNFFQNLQQQMAAGISALAISLNEQYTITRQMPTEDVKIFSDVYHALSLHRRHGIIPFLDSGVKQILDSCPIDDFLFGKSFPDHLKSSNEAQRLSSTIKKRRKVAHYVSPKTPVTRKSSHPKAGPSGMSDSLNFRRSQFRSRKKKEEGRPRPKGAYARR